MAAPALNITLPDYGNNSVVMSQQFTAIRENILSLMMLAVAAGYMMPGWSSTVQGSVSKPTAIVMQKNSSNVRMRWTNTWDENSRLTLVKWEFDSGLGSGYELVSEGNISINYDVSGNWVGTTSSA